MIAGAMALTTASFSRARVERVIGLVRIGIAGSSLFAVWMDPAEPGRYASLTYSLHSIYLAYSLVLGALMWRRDSKGWVPVATQVGDIAVASVFQYLTLGPSSPFFTYFVFSLFSAALRWGWRETMRTAAIVLVAFVVMGISLSRTLGPAEFELSRFIIRLAYLGVVTVVLVYLGQHEERLREEIRRLARWPMPVSRDMPTVLPQLLEHSAGVVGASRAIVAWNTEDEPWLYVSEWPVRRLAVEKIPPGDLEPLVAEGLRDATFASVDPANAMAAVEISGGAPEWRGVPVHRRLLERFGGASVVSAPFGTDDVSGRVFFCDLSSTRADIMPLVEVVGREIGGSLDHLQSHERARVLAVTEERLRLARDLHDGVLQSLTGIRLELQDMAHGDVDPDAASVGERLLQIERALAMEQRELRLFIDGLKPSPMLPARVPLAARLDEVGRRIALEWRAPIDMRVDPEGLTMTEASDRAVPLMVHEAIVNALKHGQPTRVSVAVHASDARLRIVVTDDGRGFPFSGRREHAALVAANAGPVSLRERVAQLGGQICIESSASGSRVELSIPLEVAHA